MDDLLFKNATAYWPSLTEEVVEWRDTGRRTLTVKLNTGELYMYDDMDHSVRRLPGENELMSEEVYRREFGMRLRRMLLYKCMSQRDLSELTGFTQSQISTYISGKVSPSSHALYRIAKALDCTIDELCYVGIDNT